MAPAEIWRTAHLLMETFQGEAALIAAKRADSLRDAQDVKGFSAWCRIVVAITALERSGPAEGERVH